MDEQSSSAEEIPFKVKNTKDMADKLDPKNDSEGSDMDEDEYAVEKIIGHRFGKKGVLELRVKWQGYPEAESTWEPEAHLDGCPEDLQAYFDQIGGRPDPKQTTSASKPDPQKKRKLSSNAVSESSPTPTRPGRPGRPKQQTKQNGPGIRGPADGVYPDGSWEDHVLNVDTMEKDDKTGKIYAFIVWKDNKKTKHPTELVYMKCPQKCLQFYEAHLQFHTPATQTPPPVAPVQHSTMKSDRSSLTKDLYDDDDDLEDGLDLGIKGVASALT